MVYYSEVNAMDLLIIFNAMPPGTKAISFLRFFLRISQSNIWFIKYMIKTSCQNQGNYVLRGEKLSQFVRIFLKSIFQETWVWWNSGFLYTTLLFLSNCSLFYFLFQWNIIFHWITNILLFFAKFPPLCLALKFRLNSIANLCTHTLAGKYSNERKKKQNRNFVHALNALYSCI